MDYTIVNLYQVSVDDLDTIRDDVYRVFLTKNFPNLDDDEINSLVLLTLICKYSSNHRREFYDLIQSYVGILGVSSIDKKSKKFLTSFNNLLKVLDTKQKIRRIEDFFIESEDTDYKELAKVFLNGYSKDAVFNFIREDLNQSEELRRTLIELIMSKQIPLLGVRGDIMKELEKILSTKRLYTRTYLLIAEGLDKKMKDYIKYNLPGIIGGGWSRNIPGKKSRVFSVFLIKADDIETIDKFYHHMKRLLGKDEECFMLISSTDFVDSKIHVFPKDNKFSKKKLNEGLEIINYMKSGFYHTDVDIWSLITQSNIGIEELLSSIPFNVFVTDLSDHERTIIISNYQKIKEEFKVERLSDWKIVDPTKLSEYLSTLKYNGYMITEKRCLEISKKIKEKSEEFDKSLKPLKL